MHLLLDCRSRRIIRRFSRILAVRSLQELRNRILGTTLTRSLFWLIRLCIGLQFLRLLLENMFFVILWFLWIKTSKYASSCYVILICSFVLILYKNPPFLNNRLFTKVLQYYVKTCFQRCFEFFLKKTSFIRKSMEQS